MTQCVIKTDHNKLIFLGASLNLRVANFCVETCMSYQKVKWVLLNLKYKVIPLAKKNNFEETQKQKMTQFHNIYRNS